MSVPGVLAAPLTADIFDSFNGLPLHPLVVHAVVVLLPLSAIGAILVVIVPRWSPRFGPLVVIGAFIAMVSSFIATKSGEALQTRLGFPDGQPDPHVELGDRLPWFAVGFFILVTALWLLDHRSASRTVRSGPVHGNPVRRDTTGWVIAVLVVLGAVFVMYWTYRVGDSGAEAVWGGR